MFYNLIKNKKGALISIGIFTIFHIILFLLDNEGIVLLIIIFLAIIELVLTCLILKSKNK